MSYPSNLSADDRPNHTRLTSSAFLLPQQNNNNSTNKSTNHERSTSAQTFPSNSTYSAFGDAKYKSYEDAGADAAVAHSREGSATRGGSEEEGREALVGGEAMKLGSSFFCFGMLIGEHPDVRVNDNCD